MKIGSIVVAFLTMISLLYLVYGVMFRSPYIEYDPLEENLSVGLQSDSPPEQIVKDFLLGGEFLPQSGTPIMCCTSTLEWNRGTPGNFTIEPQRRIRDVVISKVVRSTDRSFLGNLLDDDPTHLAVVYVNVETADNQIQPMCIKLWDYGLLTPWAVPEVGDDGWKPAEILWLARERKLLQHSCQSTDVSSQ